jgi:hypothetical protein
MADPPVSERHKPHFHRDAPVKDDVRAATTASITISTALNNGDSLDNVTLATGDRVLVKDQSTDSQNGIYVVGVTPVRAYDLSTDDPAFGFLVYVRQGTANAGTLWKNTNTTAPTIDSTSLTFGQITGGSGAPTTVDYLVGTADAGLSAEIVVGTTPGGELGGTWASPTVDGTHSGSTHDAATNTHIADTTDAHDASAISIVDTGGYFTGTEVEAALQELGAIAGGATITTKDEGSTLSSTVTTLDFTGAGVTASGSGATTTVNIPGGSGGTDNWQIIIDPFAAHSNTNFDSLIG